MTVASGHVPPPSAPWSRQEAGGGCLHHLYPTLVITSSPPPQPRQINTVKAVADHHDILCVNFSGYKKTISPVISVSFVERDVEMPSTFCDVSIVSRDGLF